uniref:Cysteine-rich antimicrobial peptide n=1 Tax=Rhipicephalus haemaphysaloides TaxID=237073 RepID=E7DT70_RHIHE|nr:cysteine-rich antimicrobial peptide [Rhipicephalus haemaphysaloides]
MAWNSQMMLTLWIVTIVLIFSSSRCERILDLRKTKKSCKNGEVLGCVSGHGPPGCSENECGMGPRPKACFFDCHYGCWCTGKLYRRKRDRKCVPKHECLL